MKHLKRFNEADENDLVFGYLSYKERELLLEELNEFCSINLAYLQDDGYSFTNFVYTDDFKKEVSHFILDKDGENFNWNEIKDQFISFVHRLNRKYIIINNHFCDEVLFTYGGNGVQHEYFSIKDLDQVSLLESLCSIIVSISFIILLHEDQ